jgi:hypothetical protein
VFTSKRSRCFTPFCYKAPCQYTQFLHLRPLIFGLKSFGLLITLFVMGTELFIYAFLIYTRILETQVGCKKRVWSIRYIECYYKLQNFPSAQLLMRFAYGHELWVGKAF